MSLDPATPDPVTLPPLAEYHPQPALRVPATEITAPAWPMIDAHNHLGRWLSAWVGRPGEWMVEDVDALLAMMDRWRIETVVNLDGRWGAELEANLERYDRAHPGRFATFCHADWSLLRDDPAAAARRLADGVRASVAAGARGLKVWKDLGLAVRDDRGSLVLPDDERLRPVWDAVAQAGVPVLIHTADPVAFWAPLDARNERLEELAAHPEWWFGHGGVPSYETLMEAFEALVTGHPDVRFVGAHVASSAEDLERVAGWLQRLPNLVVDVSARLGELGRQPRAARALVERFPDRVLLGTDAFPPDDATYALHVRTLETADEHFAYGTDPADPAPQGRWRISGLHLPPDVLRRVYAGNARTLLK